MRQGAVIIVLLLATLPLGVSAQTDKCSRKWMHRKPTDQELELILREHSDWIRDNRRFFNHAQEPNYSDVRYANLCRVNLNDVDLNGADLRKANLHRATLYNANLSGANLRGAKLDRAILQQTILTGARLTEADLSHVKASQADLSGATLTDANLSKAVLGRATLTDANLLRANLSGAKLGSAILSEADLTDADLSGAGLTRATLTDANLKDTNLSGATLAGANLDGALYEARNDAIPLITAVASARNLFGLRFDESPAALYDLKAAFKDNGFRQQEREITYAIKRSEWSKAKKDGQFIEPLFNRLLFDIPVAYGRRPGRALLILISLIPFFALFYGISLSDLNKKSGIWRVWPPDRADAAMGSDKPELMTESGWRVHMYALYFSLLSAFRIGWRELNVGNWIARIQPRTYVMQASGWVRTVSGIQSLISVYLVAIWALSYFGRPFE